MNLRRKILKNNRLFILFGLLVIISVFLLITFSKKTNLEIHAWYNNDWQYRRSVTVSNTSGATKTNEDVLIVIDTSTIITASKMQSSCNDIRFVDSDDITLLSYWIEDGCNTTSTKIWVRIPSLPNGGKTIYLYYGNNSATKGSLDWNGNIYICTLILPAQQDGLEHQIWMEGF